MLLLALCLRPILAEEKEVLPLPKQHILQAYKDGELDSVVMYIRLSRPKPVFLNTEDSILAFKCLGVIYSADSTNREKGRYYFNQLLRLNPSATITDFFPGEKVRQIFKEVRDEFFEVNPKMAIQVAPVAPPPKTDTTIARAAPSSSPRQPSRIWWWVGGGAAIAAGGAAAYIVITDPDPKVYSLHD